MRAKKRETIAEVNRKEKISKINTRIQYLPKNFKESVLLEL